MDFKENEKTKELFLEFLNSSECMAICQKREDTYLTQAHKGKVKVCINSSGENYMEAGKDRAIYISYCSPWLFSKANFSYQRVAESLIKKVGFRGYFSFCVKAMQIHESGHINYTSFEPYENFVNMMVERLKDSGVARSVAFQFSSNWFNIIEDGRIECLQVRTINDKSVRSAILLCGNLLRESAPITETPSSDEEDFVNFMNGVNIYSKTGKVPIGYKKYCSGTEGYKALESVLLDVENSILSGTCRQGTVFMWKAFISAEEYITKHLLKASENSLEKLLEELAERLKDSFGKEKDEKKLSKSSAAASWAKKPEPKKEEEEGSGTPDSSSSEGENSEDEGEGGASSDSEGDMPADGSSSGSSTGEGEEGENPSGETSEADGEGEENSSDSEDADSESSSASGSDTGEGEEEGENSSEKNGEDENSDASDSTSDNPSEDSEEDKKGDVEGSAAAGSSSFEGKMKKTRSESNCGLSAESSGASEPISEIEVEDTPLSDEDMAELIKSLDVEGFLVKAEKSILKRKKDKETVVEKRYTSYNGGPVVYQEILEKDPYEPLPQEFVFAEKQFEKELAKILRLRNRPLSQQKTGVLNTSEAFKALTGQFEVFSQPGRKSKSFAVTILVDNSGSMSGSKDFFASAACAVMEKPLIKNGVALRCVKFEERGSVVMHHVTRDFGNKAPKNTAMGFLKAHGAGCNNFDGFSIRKETEILLKRKEEVKFLFVLSDGLPASSYYRGTNNGLYDVKDAVKSAREKGVRVVAIMFGDDNFIDRTEETYRFMYEEDILACNPKNLPKVLPPIIKKAIKE